MENIYPEGSAVHAKLHPEVELIVRRYAKRIYYCRVQASPAQKELVYYERELNAGTAAL